MTPGQRIRRLVAMQPHQLARLLWLRGSDVLVCATRRQVDRLRPTFGMDAGILLRLRPLRVGPPTWTAAATSELTAASVGCFDLLGSGSADLGSAVPGWTAVDSANRARAVAIARTISAGHRALDWQRDGGSGQRWDVRAWYRDIRYGQVPGVDVKWPWEFARVQHLPRLALAAVHHPDRGLAERCRVAVRDQTLDLIASNPPRRGVNWACAMDVGIRIANVLLAHDLLAGEGHPPDADLQAVLAAATRDHARFLVANLEWSSTSCGNHYLADVCGLLWAAAHLEPSRESDAWLAFAAQEVLAEARHQFLPDGANFEASTSYHRLSGEMVVYAFALLADLPASRFSAYDHRVVRQPVSLRPSPLLPSVDDRLVLPAWTGDLLAGIHRFSAAIRTPNGGSLQVGDNDSGRFFKLDPAWRDGVEDHLDQSHLRAAIAALVEAPDLTSASGVDALVVAALAGGRRLSAAGPRRPAAQIPAADPAERFRALAVHLPARQSYRLAAPAGTDLRAGLELIAFPDFGLWVWRSLRLWLAVHGGSIGQDGNGGHAHYDQLAIELWFDDLPRIIDPGTGVYTPDPAMRNAFRAPAAHWAPQSVGGQGVPNGMPAFSLRGAVPGTCIATTDTMFLGQAVGADGARLLRWIRIAADAVAVDDAADRPLVRLPPHATRDTWSPGYGIVRPVPPSCRVPCI